MPLSTDDLKLKIRHLRERQRRAKYDGDKKRWAIIDRELRKYETRLRRPKLTRPRGWKLPPPDPSIVQHASTSDF